MSSQRSSCAKPWPSFRALTSATSGAASWERIDVDVVAAAAKPAGAAQRVSFGANAERLMALDDFALDAIALLTVTGSAH